jgi:hypothetical protein
MPRPYRIRPEVASTRALLAGYRRRGRPETDPDVIQARQKLAELSAKAKRDKAIDTLVAEWPDLSHEQVARVVGLLRSGREPP